MGLESGNISYGIRLDDAFDRETEAHIAGVLLGEQYSTGFTVDYSLAVLEGMQDWAVPKIPMYIDGNKNEQYGFVPHCSFLSGSYKLAKSKNVECGSGEVILSAGNSVLEILAGAEDYRPPLRNLDRFASLGGMGHPLLPHLALQIAEATDGNFIASS